MGLPASVARHHTAWIECPHCRPHPVRYAVDGDRMVSFCDGLPEGARDGQSVNVTVHEIAGGPPLAHLSTTLHEVTADELDPNAVLELLEHVSLGRTPDEVDAAIERHRHRRFVTYGS